VSSGEREKGKGEGGKNQNFFPLPFSQSKSYRCFAKFELSSRQQSMNESSCKPLLKVSVNLKSPEKFRALFLHGLLNAS